MVARAHDRMVPEVELHMEAGHVVEDIARVVRVGDPRTFLLAVRHREVAGMVLEVARHMVLVLVVEDMGYERYCTAVVAM